MELKNLEAIVKPRKIDGDDNNFAEAAFNRAANAIPEKLSTKALFKFAEYLAAEADEMSRQADFYSYWTPLYDPNVYKSREQEAAAFKLMLAEFRKLSGEDLENKNGELVD